MKAIVLALLLALLLSGPGVLGGQEGSLAPNAGFALSKDVVAGGGAQVAGDSYELGASAGQPATSDASGGSFRVQAGFWSACLAGAASEPVLTITTDNVNITLTWSAVPVDVAYQVWATELPYFSPEDPGGVTPVVTDLLTYPDPGWAASVANRFYVVRGVNACGGVSGISGRVGEFTFALATGT